MTALGVVPNKTTPAIRTETTTTTTTDNDDDGPRNSRVVGGSSGDVLRDWYERGQADAHEFLHRVTTNNR